MFLTRVEWVATKPAPRYELFAIVYHHGPTAVGGHYTADVRRDDGWLRMDDCKIEKRAKRTEGVPYLLFYVRA